jgi:cbb3-type cytochrome oxidase cytochrome c subunit
MILRNFAFICLLLSLLPLTVEAGVLESNNCGSCHRLDISDTEKPFSGPDLHYAGSKFQLEWLKRFLNKPAVIRPAGFIADPGFLHGAPEKLASHPSFSEQEAAALAESLMDLKGAGQTLEPFSKDTLSKGQRAKIKYQLERTFGCISCHQNLNLAGKVRGGISGPSLVNAGNRLQAAWVATWLKTPEIYMSKSRMPRYKMDTATQNLFVQFIMTLKKENIK